MFEVPEQYYVQYGTDPSNLDQTTDPILSPMDTSVVNMTYDTTLQELEPGIIYYFRVAAAFNEIFVRYSEIIQFITLEQGMFSLILPLINGIPLLFYHQCRANIVSPIFASHLC